MVGTGIEGNITWEHSGGSTKTQNLEIIRKTETGNRNPELESFRNPDSINQVNTYTVCPTEILFPNL